MELKSPESNDCLSDKVTKVAGGINDAVLVDLKPYTEYTVKVKSVFGYWGKDFSLDLLRPLPSVRVTALFA